MKKKVAFIGSGLIGSGLAVNALLHGYEVALQTRSRVELMKTRVDHILNVFVENELCSAEEAAECLERACFTTSIEEACEGAFFIQESGPEALETKLALIGQIEDAAASDAIISSSTSKKMPSELQTGAQHPERILVGHPYHPSYLLPLVEVCGSENTDQAVVKDAVAFYESIGKLPIVCAKERYGLLVNKASWDVLNDAKAAVFDGCCSVEDMDKAIMFGPGLRMALTGQIMTIALGVEGGARAQAAKYGRVPSHDDEVIADGVDEEMADRPEEIGRDEESVSAFRDRAIIEILRMQKML